MSDRLSAADMAALMLQLSDEERDAVRRRVQEAASTLADPKGREMYARSAAPALAIFEQARRLDAFGLNALRIAVNRYCRNVKNTLEASQTWPDDMRPVAYVFMERGPTSETRAANLCAQVDYDPEVFNLARYGRQFEDAKPLRFTPIPEGAGGLAPED